MHLLLPQPKFTVKHMINNQNKMHLWYQDESYTRADSNKYHAHTHACNQIITIYHLQTKSLVRKQELYQKNKITIAL